MSAFLLTLCFILSFSPANAAVAATEKTALPAAKKKKKKITQKQVVALPTFKAKRKVRVDFGAASDSDAVVVRNQSDVDRALEKSYGELDANNVRLPEQVIPTQAAAPAEKTEPRLEVAAPVATLASKPSAAQVPPGVPTILPPAKARIKPEPVRERLTLEQQVVVVQSPPTPLLEPVLEAALKPAAVPVAVPAAEPVAEPIESAPEPAPAPVPVAAEAAVAADPPRSSVAAPRELTLQIESETPERIARRRVYLKTSYLNARYDRLESQLHNGASTFAIGVGQNYSPELEGSLFLEIAHGLDQTLEPGNIRSTFVLAQAMYSPTHISKYIAPVLGGAVGLGRYNVRSYRAQPNGKVAIAEHLAANALILSPIIGVRLELMRELTIEALTQYVLPFGTGNDRALGGLQLGLGLGYLF